MNKECYSSENWVHKPRVSETDTVVSLRRKTSLKVQENIEKHEDILNHVVRATWKM